MFEVMTQFFDAVVAPPLFILQHDWWLMALVVTYASALGLVWSLNRELVLEEREYAARNRQRLEGLRAAPGRHLRRTASRADNSERRRVGVSVMIPHRYLLEQWHSQRVKKSSWHGIGANIAHVLQNPPTRLIVVMCIVAFTSMLTLLAVVSYAAGN